MEEEEDGFEGEKRLEIDKITKSKDNAIAFSSGALVSALIGAGALLLTKSDLGNKTSIIIKIIIGIGGLTGTVVCGFVTLGYIISCINHKRKLKMYNELEHTVLGKK